jgi:hypothetical protein
LLLVAVLEV